MEDELRQNLLRCAEAYAQARGIGLPTLARMSAGDWRFFDRLRDDEKTFTARKYDEVVDWFSRNWPDGVDWPHGVGRVDLSQNGAAH
jgi:hypothetical protein